MEQETNLLLQRAKVLGEPSVNFAIVQFEDGTNREIPVYSPKEKGHITPLQKGEVIIAVFSKNAFEYTLSGVRQRVLQQIIYPHDEDYQNYVALEKNPASKEEHRVEKVFQRRKA